MPGKNILKNYVENGVYHIYNRGVEKRDIFTSKNDYIVFLYFLKQYLLSLDDPEKDHSTKERILLRRSFKDKIEIMAFCLMPNHFHLVVRQKGKNDMTEFMKCLGTSYSMYFNGKYSRVGSLFQGRYKAALVLSDDYLLHLTRYVHLNPVEAGLCDLAEKYEFSSYKDYIGENKIKWISPKFVLDYFSQNNSLLGKSDYKKFVEEYGVDPRSAIETLSLD